MLIIHANKQNYGNLKQVEKSSLTVWYKYFY